MILKISVGLIGVYLIYLIIERVLNKRYRQQIKYVIHVNGTRGKSTVTRLIGTMLNRNNISTITKVTGTIPTIIFFDETQKIIKRIGNANIKEQLKLIKLAAKNKVDALVIECMAVNPNYQKITEEVMLQANITIITNARRDHQEVMGENLESITASLGQTIPLDGVLIIPQDLERYYKKTAYERNTKIITFDKYITNQNIDLYDENVAIALAVANLFKIDRDKALESMVNYPKDIGSIRQFKEGNHIFISAFSINDNDSLLKTINLLKENHDLSNLTILLNNRSDRQFRLREQIELLKNLKPPLVIVAGSNFNYTKHELNKANIEVIKYHRNLNLETHEIVLGMGNVKGAGLKLITQYINKQTSV